MNKLKYDNLKVTSEDTNAALRAQNQKYKFGKVKQNMSGWISFKLPILDVADLVKYIIDDLWNRFF